MVASWVLTVACLPLVQAHYVLFRIAHNGQWFRPFEHIRNISLTAQRTKTMETGPERLWSDPVWLQDTPADLRCGRDHMDRAREVKTLTVHAGDTISFGAMTTHTDNWGSGTNPAYWDECLPHNTSCLYGEFYHPGPAAAYLSPVPEGMEIADYDGSGPWTKIASVGLDTSLPRTEPPQWLVYNYSKELKFRIPPTTAPGLYLFRDEHIAVSHHVGGAQFFVNCVHVNIVGPGGGTLTPSMRIPEDFSPTDPGLLISYDMASGYSVDEGYRDPGSAVWHG